MRAGDKEYLERHLIALKVFCIHTISNAFHMDLTQLKHNSVFPLFQKLLFNEKWLLFEFKIVLNDKKYFVTVKKKFHSIKVIRRIRIFRVDFR